MLRPTTTQVEQPTSQAPVVELRKRYGHHVASAYASQNPLAQVNWWAANSTVEQHLQERKFA